MKRIVIIPIICILLLSWGTTVTPAAVITCTVTIAEPAPFTVEVTSSAPNNTVEEGEEFEVVAEIQIRSGEAVRIKQATARIDFDTSGLTLLRPKQVRNLRTITEKNAKNKSIWWILEGVTAGTYVVQVTISGVNEAGNPVAQHGSVNITVVKPSSVEDDETSPSSSSGWQIWHLSFSVSRNFLIVGE